MRLKIPLHIAMPPASGTGKYWKESAKTIRFAQHGCTNRLFFHIVVAEVRKSPTWAPIEQVGTYDPMPNIHNEKLVSLNFERIQHWLEMGALMTEPVAQLLGLSGYLPMHPRTYLTAWRNRRKIEEAAKATPQEKAES